MSRASTSINYQHCAIRHSAYCLDSYLCMHDSIDSSFRISPDDSRNRGNLPKINAVMTDIRREAHWESIMYPGLDSSRSAPFGVSPASRLNDVSKKQSRSWPGAAAKSYHAGCSLHCEQSLCFHLFGGCFPTTLENKQNLTSGAEFQIDEVSLIVGDATS